MSRGQASAVGDREKHYQRVSYDLALWQWEKGSLICVFSVEIWDKIPQKIWKQKTRKHHTNVCHWARKMEIRTSIGRSRKNATREAKSSRRKTHHARLRCWDPNEGQCPARLTNTVYNKNSSSPSDSQSTRGGREKREEKVKKGEMGSIKLLRCHQWT